MFIEEANIKKYVYGVYTKNEISFAGLIFLFNHLKSIEGYKFLS